MTDPVATIFYCPTCETSHPIKVADMRPGTHHEYEGMWGDIICTVCRTSIMTLQVSSPGLYAFKKMTEKVNEPGTYSFMKVGELAQRAALPEETHVPGTKWRKSSRVAAGSRRLSHASRPA